MKTAKIPEAEYRALVNSSQMLGRIASHVAPWCCEPESTTYEAVLALKAEVYRLRASELERELADEIEGRSRNSS